MFVNICFIEWNASKMSDSINDQRYNIAVKLPVENTIYINGRNI
jgi:hypothetical protein